MGGSMMNSKFLEELRQRYMKNPPEGMTSKLVKNMTDSDLLDMHYFLTEDEDLDGLTLKLVSRCAKRSEVSG